MAGAKFGSSKPAKQGGMKARPANDGYMKGDTGKPGGTPTGSTPGLGGRMEGVHVPGVGGSGTSEKSGGSKFSC